MWRKKLPSLQRLARLKRTTPHEVLPIIIAMPQKALVKDRWFVLLEFRREIIVAAFWTEEDAELYASAIYETLQTI